MSPLFSKENIVDGTPLTSDEIDAVLCLFNEIATQFLSDGYGIQIGNKVLYLDSNVLSINP